MNVNNLSYLDNLRLNQGADRLKNEFADLAAKHRAVAIRHINNDKLLFPTLYILMPVITAYDLYDQMIPRNNIAIRICANKSRNFALAFRLGRLRPRGSENNRAAYKWMFDTGLHWEGEPDIREGFDAAIDAASALLICVHKDTSILPAVCDLVFRRYNKELLIHDLVWGFFQSYDPVSLLLIAKYLLSDDVKDIELACRLLHLSIPETGVINNGQPLYERYLAWFNENNPYLHFTGEHFQQTSEPNPLHLDHEAKYLAKRLAPKDGHPLDPVTPDETACLIRFRKASHEDQELLSSYSAKLHRRNKGLWQEWIGGDVSEQVETAMAEMQVIL